MKFSVIVALDNTYELVSHFMENLITTTSFIDGELIIFIDGGTDYRTIKYLRQIAVANTFITLLYGEKRHGYSEANNIAASRAEGEYLVFINSDVLPQKNSVSLLTDYLNEDESCGAVQGLLIYPQNYLVQSTGHLFLKTHNSHVYSGQTADNTLIQTVAKRQALTSAFTAIRKSLFIELGMFDISYYNAYEGMELTLKITLKGFKCIYCPQAIAYHITGGSRSNLAFDDKMPGILFWQRWKEKIIPDIHTYLMPQITHTIKKHIYFLVVCNDILDIKKVLKQLEIQISEEITLHALNNQAINLYHELPYAALKYKGPYLFVVSNITNLSNNANWALNRNNSDDIVIDLSANVTSFLELNRRS